MHCFDAEDNQIARRVYYVPHGRSGSLRQPLIELLLGQAGRPKKVAEARIIAQGIESGFKAQQMGLE